MSSNVLFRKKKKWREVRDIQFGERWQWMSACKQIPSSIRERISSATSISSGNE